MKKGYTKLLFFILIAIFRFNSQAQNNISSLPINKVILWGHKLHSHTHSYIHWGFKRAFEHMGYDTYWFDNDDNVADFDFSCSLFITEGQVDNKIPLKDDCFYIIHNCDTAKYQKLLRLGHCIFLQVYTHDCLTYNLAKLDDYIYTDVESTIIFMPWATDLLPHEIDNVKSELKTKKKDKLVYFVGTVDSNLHLVEQFKAACHENNIKFNIATKCSMKDNINYIQTSYMAPAIQEPWQCANGYIPCRIFKNISYGAFGITNSKTVYELFNKKIVYNPDTYQLFYDAQEKLAHLDINELYELMDFVKEKHTYINRINTLLTFFEEVYQLKNAQ